MRAPHNLVTDQKRGRKIKSAENGEAKDFFPNCCRNVTIRNKILNSELPRREAERRDAQSLSCDATLEKSLRHSMMLVGWRVIAL